ncbi:hypothetical protein CDD82_5338 [Ophiocordyceps australis]|uniref:Uncharacterized protein n=1 Tax=Ophiocordyceps australis TaxID=1399860 RepID=A0A2C5Z1G5_9HYPO|nr:hypothetical protein CDD82_5338 [Ophiocordyceps australis]
MGLSPSTVSKTQGTDLQGIITQGPRPSSLSQVHTFVEVPSNSSAGGLTASSTHPKFRLPSVLAPVESHTTGSESQAPLGTSSAYEVPLPSSGPTTLMSASPSAGILSNLDGPKMPKEPRTSTGSHISDLEPAPTDHGGVSSSLPTFATLSVGKSNETQVATAAPNASSYSRLIMPSFSASNQFSSDNPGRSGHSTTAEMPKNSDSPLAGKGSISPKISAHESSVSNSNSSMGSAPPKTASANPDHSTGSKTKTMAREKLASESSSWTSVTMQPTSAQNSANFVTDITLARPHSPSVPKATARLTITDDGIGMPTLGDPAVSATLAWSQQEGPSRNATWTHVGVSRNSRAPSGCISGCVSETREHGDPTGPSHSTFQLHSETSTDLTPTKSLQDPGSLASNMPVSGPSGFNRAPNPTPTASITGASGILVHSISSESSSNYGSESLVDHDKHVESTLSRYTPVSVTAILSKNEGELTEPEPSLPQKPIASSSDFGAGSEPSQKATLPSASEVPTKSDRAWSYRFPSSSQSTYASRSNGFSESLSSGLAPSSGPGSVPRVDNASKSLSHISIVSVIKTALVSKSLFEVGESTRTAVPFPLASSASHLASSGNASRTMTDPLSTHKQPLKTNSPFELDARPKNGSSIGKEPTVEGTSYPKLDPSNPNLHYQNGSFSQHGSPATVSSQFQAGQQTSKTRRDNNTSTSQDLPWTTSDYSQAGSATSRHYLEGGSSSTQELPSMTISHPEAGAGSLKPHLEKPHLGRPHLENKAASEHEIPSTVSAYPQTGSVTPKLCDFEALSSQDLILFRARIAFDYQRLP